MYRAQYISSPSEEFPNQNYLYLSWYKLQLVFNLVTTLTDDKVFFSSKSVSMAFWGQGGFQWINKPEKLNHPSNIHIYDITCSGIYCPAFTSTDNHAQAYKLQVHCPEHGPLYVPIKGQGEVNFHLLASSILWWILPSISQFQGLRLVKENKLKVFIS